VDVDVVSVGPIGQMPKQGDYVAPDLQKEPRQAQKGKTDEEDGK
jgi:hypothetical protein